MKIIRYINSKEIEGAMPPLFVKNTAVVAAFSRIYQENSLHPTTKRELNRKK